MNISVSLLRRRRLIGSVAFLYSISRVVVLFLVLCSAAFEYKHNRIHAGFHRVACHGQTHVRASRTVDLGRRCTGGIYLLGSLRS